MWSGEDDQSSDLPVYDVRDTIFYDDFLEDQNAWNWRQRKFTIRDGCVFLNITANRSGDACSILRDGYLKHGGFETRLRTSSLELPMLAFGFYGSQTGIQFMWFSNHSTEATRGLHAFCEIDDLTAFWEPIEINMADWHVYTIIWEPGNATFIIDGEIVARTDQVPNDALEICLYCMCKASSAETLAIGGRADCGNLPGIRMLNDQYTQIDYIEIFEVEGV